MKKKVSTFFDFRIRWFASANRFRESIFKEFFACWRMLDMWKQIRMSMISERWQFERLVFCDQFAVSRSAHIWRRKILQLFWLMWRKIFVDWLQSIKNFWTSLDSQIICSKSRSKTKSQILTRSNLTWKLKKKKCRRWHCWRLILFGSSSRTKLFLACAVVFEARRWDI